MRVYVYMVEDGNAVTIRGVQRALGFASPATAQYHLKRLEHLGFVKDDAAAGGYILQKRVRPSFLQLFFLFGGFLIPKSLVYLLASVFVNVACVFLLPLQSGLLPYALIPGSLGSLLLLVESLGVWRLKRRELRD